MNNFNKLIYLISIGLALAACGEKTRTEEWYVAHPEELKKEVEKCKTKSLPELLQDKHCQDIEKARIKAFNEQQRNGPSTDFEFKSLKDSQR